MQPKRLVFAGALAAAVTLAGAPRSALAQLAQSQVSDQGFRTTLGYSGPEVNPGSTATVDAVVRNLTGAPQSAARAEFAAGGAMSSFMGAGWSCAINSFFGGIPTPTGYICFYSGPVVPDGSDFPSIFFDVTVPVNGVTPGANASAFKRLNSGGAYLFLSGIASYAQTIPTGVRSTLFVLIDDPVELLEPRLPTGNSDRSLTAVAGNDVVTSVSLTNVSNTTTVVGAVGLVVGGGPYATPFAPFVPTVAGWSCSNIGDRGPGYPLWQCLAPSPVSLAPFQAVEVTLRLANASPAGTTLPDEIWGFFEIAPILDGVRGVNDVSLLRRSLRAVDDLFVLPSTTAPLDVLANDPDPVAGGLNVLAAGPPLSGCAQIDVDTTLTYTPCGLPDEFTYTVGDSIGRSATATVRLVDLTSPSARLVSLAPVDPATLPSPPAGVTFPNGVFTFSLAVAPGATVDVQFTLPRPISSYYKLDSQGWSLFCDIDCASGSVLILTLTDGGRGDADGVANGVIVDPGAPAVSSLGAPVANDDSFATSRDVPLTIPPPGVLGNDTDPDGDLLTAALVSGPAHGTLLLNPDGSFSYTPASAFAGGDSFTYSANDGTAASNVATVSLMLEDQTAPSVTIATPGDGASYTQYQFVAADYSCQDEPGGSGLASCSGPVLDGSPIDTATVGNHSFTVTGTDNAGNPGTVTHTYTVVDTIAPIVTIDQASGQADPTGSSPINFQVVFSEPVNGFGDSSGDVALSGTAGATTVVLTGGPTTYSVAVSGMTGNGTVIASIPAGAATDAAGNGNMASTSTDNTVTIVTAPPDPCPAVPLLDNFNRGDGRLGSNWGGLTDAAFYKIKNQEVDVELGGAVYWKPAAFGASQAAFVTLSAADTESVSQGVLLKVQTGTLPNAGAIAVVYDGKARAVRVSTFRLGVLAWKSYGNTPVTFVNDDKLTAWVSATGVVKVYKNCELVATVTLTGADASFFNSRGGKIGLWTAAALKAVLDDFGGGTIP